MDNYVVYVRVDENGCITEVNSSAFLADTSGWVEIDSGRGDRFHHAQGNYFPQPIFTEGGAYRYRLVDGAAVTCSAEEIARQEEALRDGGKTPAERIAKLEEQNALLTRCILELSEVLYA